VQLRKASIRVRTVLIPVFILLLGPQGSRGVLCSSGHPLASSICLFSAYPAQPKTGTWAAVNGLPHISLLNLAPNLSKKFSRDKGGLRNNTPNSWCCFAGLVHDPVTCTPVLGPIRRGFQGFGNIETIRPKCLTGICKGQHCSKASQRTAFYKRRTEINLRGFNILLS